MSPDDNIIPFKLRIKIRSAEQFIDDTEATINNYKNHHEQSIMDKLINIIDNLDDSERVKVLEELRTRYFDFEEILFEDGEL